MNSRMKVVRKKETDRETIRKRRRIKKKTKRRMEFYRDYVWKKWICRRGRRVGT